MSNKKKEQLGMNPSTASNRLVKDILWKLIIQTEQHLCCKCHKEMTRDTFSIEHINSWLDSDDPVGLYFDLENIAFSHLSCNISDARKVNKRTDHEQYAIEKRESNARRARANYNPDRRKNRYLRTGH